MDMRKVFKDTSSIPPQLLAKVQTSKLKTKLCEDCLKLSERFSRLQRHLEKIKLEINFCLSEIHQKFTQENDKDSRLKFHNVFGREPNSDHLLKLETVEALRKEALNQCIKFRSCQSPRVKVQNMTEEEVESEILKFKSESGKAASWDETASNSSFQSENKNSLGMDIDISKVKLEGPIPNASPDTEESSDCDWNESLNYTSFDSEDDDEHEPELKYVKLTKGSPSPETNQIQHPQSSTHSRTKGKLSSKGKINLNNRAMKKNGNRSHSVVIPPPIKMAGMIKTPQGQFIRKSGRYKCPLCEKEYGAQGAFFTHYKSIHCQEKYRCAICGKEYPYMQPYKVHYLNIHAGVKFHCVKCNQSFTQLASLERHNKGTHLGSRAHCRFCSKSFSRSIERNKHMRKYHGDKIVK